MTYAADDYVAPRPVKVMFHVDKLPYDQGMRRQLSMSLTTLAKRQHDGSAQEHRLTAQLLMLAMRLDRKNDSAVELNKRLSRGKDSREIDEESKRKAMRSLRWAIGKLSNISTSSDARILEAYLKDVHTALENNASIAITDEEKTRWEGIVPVLVMKSVSDRADPIAHGSDGRPKLPRPPRPPITDPGDEDKKPEFTQWSNHTSTITTPLIFFKIEDERTIRNEQLATMKTKISPRIKMESILSLELVPWADVEMIEEFTDKINPVMKELFGKYESVKVEITTSGRLSDRNRSRILLPLSLQLKASAEKIEIRNRICVLGNLSGDSITRGSDFYQLLKYFRNSEIKNYRILVPSNAEADLRQLIALEEEDFFVRNEVIQVSNIDEAVDMLGKSKNSSINLASVEFAKIQEMIGDKSVGPFAVNSGVKSKLEEIVAKNPNHLSAKMILLRGNPSRGRKLDSFFVADELSVVLGRTSYLNKRTADRLSAGHLYEMAQAIEEKIEELSPLLDNKDRELPVHLVEIKDYLETLARAAARRHKDEREEKRVSKILIRTLEDNLAGFKLKYKEARTQLDSILKHHPNK